VATVKRNGSRKHLHILWRASEGAQPPSGGKRELIKGGGKAPKNLGSKKKGRRSHAEEPIDPRGQKKKNQRVATRREGGKKSEDFQCGGKEGFSPTPKSWHGV